MPPRMTDFVLLTTTRLTSFRSSAMTSRVAELAVVDSLFVSLAQRDLQHAVDALERTFAAAQAKQVHRTRSGKP